MTNTSPPTSPDFLTRDSRSRPDSTPIFLPSQFLLFCLSFTCALPVGLANLAVKAATGTKLTSGTTADGTKKAEYPAVRDGPLAEINRKYDVVVYGASGFVGGLCCKYLAERYGNKVRWAIAGRRKDALEKVKAECLILNNKLQVDVLVVDAGNEVSLHEMCAQTKVVISTVGPFQLYGTPLVRACIACETHYCDITGEVDWHAGLIEHYDAEARKRKTNIVSFCGHDSIPWDLTTMMLADKLGNGKLKKIDLADEIMGNPSGGTLLTVLESLPPKPYKSQTGLKFTPLLLSAENKKSEYSTKNTSALGPVRTELGQWGGPFVMTACNSAVVGRSNALNGYGKNVEYREARVGPNLSTVVGRYFQLAALGPMLILPEFLRDRVLPQPGQGPSEAAMQASYLQVTAVATSEDGAKAGGRMYFKVDAGYRDTARMLVESGLSIALEGEKCPGKGGVLTPATCQGKVLFDRLLETGSEWTWLSNL